MTALLAWWAARSALEKGAAVFAVALTVGALVARCNPPPPARLEERREVKAEVREEVKAAAVEVRATVRHATRTETHPGGVVIVTVEDERTDTDRHEASEATTAATMHTVETRVVEAARPDWRLSAAALWRPADLTAAPPVLRAELVRRVAGPVFVGAAVSYDRPRGEVAAGVVVTVEW